MELDDLPNKGQSKARVATITFPNRIEAVENAGDIRRRDAGAVINDVHSDTAGRTPSPQTDDMEGTGV